MKNINTPHSSDKSFVHKSYECTECGGDATVALSNFKDSKTNEYLIKADERLCLFCAKKRNVTIF